MNNRVLRSAFVTSLFIHRISIFSSILGTAISFLLGFLGILNLNRLWLVPIISVLSSFLLGSIITLTAGKKIVRFVEHINFSLRQIAKGNYDTELKENPPIQELREIIQNFNTMTRELASTEMLRNDFVENVSHEFKTPLTAIEGYATLLQQNNLPEEKRKEYTQKILHNTQRLSTLTGNILLLSRLENQEQEIQKETYSLDEQLRQIILLLEPGWAKKQLELDIQLDDCTCSANPSLMAHVWQNILGNSIKFSPIGGDIRITMAANSDRIAVSISDRGPGMTEEVQKRIFEKFYQGDTTRSTPGNGLGLSLVKRIVDLHHGTIEVSSQIGSGSCFIVNLPKR